MATLPTGTDWITVPDQGSAKGLYQAQADNLYARIGSTPEAVLSILAGTVDTDVAGVAVSNLRIDTEGGAPLDDLANILVDLFEDGQWLMVSLEDPSHIVNLTNGAGGAGQMLLQGGTDATLSSRDDKVLFYVNKQGVATLEEITRFNMGGAPVVVPLPAGAYVPSISELLREPAYWTNEAAGGLVSVQLPPAQVGMSCIVSNVDLTNLMELVADGVETVLFEGNAWPGVKTVAASKFSIKLACLVAGRWDTIWSHGAWVTS